MMYDGENKKESILTRCGIGTYYPQIYIRMTFNTKYSIVEIFFNIYVVFIQHKAFETFNVG